MNTPEFWFRPTAARRRSALHVAFLCISTLAINTDAVAQPNTSERPPIVTTAGRFTAQRLAAPPLIDGKEWSEVDVHVGYPEPTLALPGFSLTLEEVDGDTGDLQRHRLLFQRGTAPPVLLEELTAWVYVTPDSRYIFTEPLYALDLREWKKYALFDALNIPNYVAIRAISADGRRLLIARRDCPYDCRDPEWEYYELRLPER